MGRLGTTYAEDMEIVMTTNEARNVGILKDNRRLMLWKKAK